MKKIIILLTVLLTGCTPQITVTKEMINEAEKLCKEYGGFYEIVVSDVFVDTVICDNNGEIFILNKNIKN